MASVENVAVVGSVRRRGPVRGVPRDRGGGLPPADTRVAAVSRRRDDGSGARAQRLNRRALGQAVDGVPPGARARGSCRPSAPIRCERGHRNDRPPAEMSEHIPGATRSPTRRVAFLIMPPPIPGSTGPHRSPKRRWSGARRHDARRRACQRAAVQRSEHRRWSSCSRANLTRTRVKVGAFDDDDSDDASDRRQRTCRRQSVNGIDSARGCSAPEATSGSRIDGPTPLGVVAILFGVLQETT